MEELLIVPSEDTLSARIASQHNCVPTMVRTNCLLPIVFDYKRCVSVCSHTKADNENTKMIKLLTFHTNQIWSQCEWSQYAITFFPLQSHLITNCMNGEVKNTHKIISFVVLNLKNEYILFN